MEWTDTVDQSYFIQYGPALTSSEYSLPGRVRKGFCVRKFRPSQAQGRLQEVAAPGQRDTGTSDREDASLQTDMDVGNGSLSRTESYSVWRAPFFDKPHEPRGKPAPPPL